MNASSAAQHQELTSQRSQRLLVRSASPIWPFIWRGLLPALGLVAVTLFSLWPFASGWIEGEVRRETQAALAAPGMKWVDVSVSGQDVLLTGTPPDKDSAAQALAIAQATRCSTWLGHLPCPINVSTAFTAPTGAVPAMPAPSVAAPAEAAVAACEKGFADVLAGAQISFHTGSATIAQGNVELLDKLTAAFTSCPGQQRVEVQGHTDAIGTPARNLPLSQARAQAVREALVQRGVPADRLVARGYGEDRPLADNQSPAGRALNRRIEFRALATN